MKNQKQINQQSLELSGQNIQQNPIMKKEKLKPYTGYFGEKTREKLNELCK